MKRFNTTGECLPGYHYMIPALRRLPDGTSSPFNVKVKSLFMRNFSAEDVRELYAQHTAETGQEFTQQALERAFEVTSGQPWLTNALAREIVEEMAVPPNEPITHTHVDKAKERLILARATHLDSLVARLDEPRVRSIVEPILAGTLEVGDSYQDDLLYVRDLGLITRENPVRVANPIYREVIVRVLAGAVEPRVLADPRSFVLPDGRLDMSKLLREFADFWREHGDILTTGLSYHEVAAQLVIMAFLQRIVNGDGHVEREYGIGQGRIDLHVRWPYRSAEGTRLWQREAIELKVWRPKKPDPREQGLSQLDGYLARLGLDSGTLVLFDRRPNARSLADRTCFEEATTPSGRRVTILRA